MIDKNNDLDLEIRAINLQLEQVKIEVRQERELKRIQSKLEQRNQRQVEDNIQGACRKRESWSRNQLSPSTVDIKNKTKSIVETELAYGEKILLEKGDKVRILKPKHGQLNRGVIVGQCVDGKIKILTDNNTIVTRLPKNMHLLVHNVIGHRH